MIALFLDALFAENLALSYFLGICTFMAVSRQVRTAVGLGISLTAVMTVTVPLNHIIFHQLLTPGALPLAGSTSVDLRFLMLVCAIGVIAAAVQILEMVLFRHAPGLYQNLGIFLPLITVNCAVLGASLFMIERQYTLSESVVYGFGGGVGWSFAVILFAAIRQRLMFARIPTGLEGLGSAFLVAGLLSMGFSAFSRML